MAKIQRVWPIDESKGVHAVEFMSEIKNIEAGINLMDERNINDFASLFGKFFMDGSIPSRCVDFAISSANVSANQNLTSSFVDLTGATITFVASTSLFIFVNAYINFASITSATGQATVQLLLDSATLSQAGQAIVKTNNASTQSQPANQIWSTFVSPGSHTVKLQGKTASGGGSVVSSSSQNSKITLWRIVA